MTETNEFDQSSVSNKGSWIAAIALANVSLEV